jgi:Transposase
MIEEEGSDSLAATGSTFNRSASVENDWWWAIEVLIVTGVTNDRIEAANTGIKNRKRMGRGYRNPAHYRGPYPPGQRRPHSSVNTRISARSRPTARSR